MRRSFLLAVFSIFNIIFIVLTIPYLLQKDSSSTNPVRLSITNVSTLHTLSPLFERNRIDELLKSYFNRYENSDNDNRLAYPLSDEEEQLFTSMTMKLANLRTKLIPYPSEAFHARGIVLSVGRQQIRYAKINLRMLEVTGSRLPVQIWYSSNQVSTEYMLQVLSIAPKLNVTICCFLIAECRSSTGVIQRLNSSYVFKPGMTHRRAKSFPYKPAAIVSSTFAEVLFLDCDSYATRDPEELFLTDPMYLKFGALFFPDGYQSRQHPFVWNVFNTSFIPDEYELDSAAILVDKRRVWDGLYMTKLINDHYKLFYSKLVTDGDKDTFRLGFRFTQTKYYLVMIPCSTGSFDGNRFCGHTLCKTDSLAKHVYINHVHLFKYENIKYSPHTLGHTRVGIGDPNRNTFYFRHCLLVNSSSSCFHVLEKEIVELEEYQCYAGNVTLDEFDDHEYTLKESLFNEKKPNNRVLMSRTNNLMPHFVNNLIEFLQ